MPQTPTVLIGESRANQDMVLAALAAAGTGTDFTTDILNVRAKGLLLVIDVTAITGTTPTLVVTIQGKDPASGKYFTILASASLNATGTVVLTVYPGSPTTANVSSAMPLPKTWRVSWTIGGTTPAVTATIGASLIL